jgi:hypothetical protein
MTAVLRAPSGAISALAGVIALAACVAAIATGAWALGALCAVAALGIAGGIALQPRPVPAPPARLIEKVTEQAESGRRLVIYERETGLFAHWYLALRGQEECTRAARYDRSLSLVVIEPLSPDNAWGIKDELASWIGHNLRACDVAAYFGNGRYVVIMPETAGDGVAHVIDRIRTEIAGVEAVIADFGADGTTYEALYTTASERLRSAASQKAA